MNPTLIDAQTFAELQANAGADFIVELVETFGEETPAILAELQAARQDGEAERFRRAAHSIKSNSHTFGARRLAEMARALELGGMPPDDAPLHALAQEIALTLAALRAQAQGDGDV